MSGVTAAPYAQLCTPPTLAVTAATSDTRDASGSRNGVVEIPATLAGAVVALGGTVTAPNILTDYKPPTRNAPPTEPETLEQIAARLRARRDAFAAAYPEAYAHAQAMSAMLGGHRWGSDEERFAWAAQWGDEGRWGIARSFGATCARCGAMLGADAQIVMLRGHPHLGRRRWNYEKAPGCTSCAAAVSQEHAEGYAVDSSKTGSGICEGCGRHLTGTLAMRSRLPNYYGADMRVICSRRCQRAKYRHPKGDQDRTCTGCGVTFTSHRSDAAYCSPGCRQRAYRARHAGVRVLVGLEAWAP